MIRFFLIFTFVVATTAAAWANVNTVDPFELDIEQLMQIEITSVTKRPQMLKDIPAAVYVISAEDIRNSGATSIPEALRLAPGMHVMGLSHNRWAISIRGAAREYSNKLQVLVDGRSVYSPTFTGVMWETLEVPLENIDRIEVIRGPGAAVWGSNAVNGVVNIITRSATETQGTLLSIAAGDKLKNSLFLRHGYDHDKNTAVRFFARGFEYGQSRQLDGQKGEDAWNNRSAGFRIDRNSPDTSDKFMLQGNFFKSRADDLLTMFSRPPSVERIKYTQKKSGYDLSARWDFAANNDKLRSVQTSFANTDLHHIFVDEVRHTFDLEFTERFTTANRHNLVWGLGTRLSWDKIDGSRHMLVPERKRLSKLFRLFVNDDIELKKNKLHLHLAAGLEHNNITGYEFQPSAKMMATPDNHNSIWLGWSRAARTPARIESGASYYAFADPTALPLPLVVDHDLNHTVSEKLDSYEVGWRHKPRENFSFDLSGFYFKFKDAYGSQQTTVTPDPAGYLVIGRGLNNNTKADLRGFEFSMNWNPHKRWQLQGAYSHIKIDFDLPAVSRTADITRNVPANTVSIFSNLRLSDNLTWNLWYRHSDRNNCGDFGPIPGFDIVDTKLAWQARKNLNLSLVAQNLFDNRHQEFLPEVLFSVQREFGRRVYVKSEWSF